MNYFVLIFTLMIASKIQGADAQTIRNYEDAVRVISDNKMTRLDEVLPYLDRSYLNRFALLFASQSSSIATLAKPRVILSNRDAKQIFAYDGQTKGPLGNRLEIAEWDEQNGKLRLRAIEFKVTGKPKFFDEPRNCVPCHATFENPTEYHPIWETYPNWIDAYGVSHNFEHIYHGASTGTGRLPVFEFEINGLKQLSKEAEAPTSRYQILKLKEFIQNSQFEAGGYQKLHNENGGYYRPSDGNTKEVKNWKIPESVAQNISEDFAYLTAIGKIAQMNSDFSEAIQILNAKRLGAAILRSLAKAEASPLLVNLTPIEAEQEARLVTNYYLESVKRLQKSLQEYGTFDDLNKINKYFNKGSDLFSVLRAGNLSLDGKLDSSSLKLKAILKSLNINEVISSVKGNFFGIGHGPYHSLAAEVETQFYNLAEVKYIGNHYDDSCNQLLWSTKRIRERKQQEYLQEFPDSDFARVVKIFEMTNGHHYSQ